jgi:spore germination protein YaaH
MGDEILEEKAFMISDRFYVGLDFAKKNICDNYYYDPFEKLLLHTGDSTTVTSDEYSGDFIIENDEVYLALDYLRRLVRLDVTIFDNTPGQAHIGIRNSWGEIDTAKLRRDCDVRVRGGVKSDILTNLKADDEVQVLERMDDWSKVRTGDGFIGYLENKDLESEGKKTLTPESEIREEEIVHNLRDHSICLGWHQVMSRDANSTLSDVTASVKGMNVISPTWFKLSGTAGGVTSIGSTDYVQKAHGMGLEVWALVDNFEMEDTYTVLGPTSIRRVLVQNLVNEAVSLGVDGINVDFETLNAECGPAFAQFIRELSVECRKNSLVLSVDNYVPKGHTSFYDRKTQGEYADYVVIMGYDEHYNGSEESGSVASFGFVQEGIEKTLADVDPAQVINGIPFYTRIWEEGTGLSSRAVGMDAAEEFVASHGMKKVWDEECAQYYAEKAEGNTLYKVWLEDEASIQAKLDLMRANHLGGVACWKLGLEKKSVWDVISQWQTGM